MIRNIVHDEILLQMKAREATTGDIELACDMADTLDVCTLFFNPKIVACSEPYMAEEGCLSLEGLRRTKRYNKITLHFQDLYMHEHEMTYKGFTAEVIQHEIDHLNGILI